jgi:hypothetical protein
MHRRKTGGEREREREREPAFQIRYTQQRSAHPAWMSQNSDLGTSAPWWPTPRDFQHKLPLLLPTEMTCYKHTENLALSCEPESQLDNQPKLRETWTCTPAPLAFRRVLWLTFHISTGQKYTHWTSHQQSPASSTVGDTPDLWVVVTAVA